MDTSIIKLHIPREEHGTLYGPPWNRIRTTVQSRKGVSKKKEKEFPSLYTVSPFHKIHATNTPQRRRTLPTHHGDSVSYQHTTETAHPTNTPETACPTNTPQRQVGKSVCCIFKGLSRSGGWGKACHAHLNY